MTQKEKELRIELGKLDEKIQVLRSKEAPVKADVEELNKFCDQVEEIDAQIQTEQRAERVSARISANTTEPENTEQPTNNDEKRFANFGEYLQAVARAGSPRGNQIDGKPCGFLDKRLAYTAETRSEGLEEATPSLGGFLVQQDFATQLFKKAHDASQLFNRVRKIPTSSNANGLKLQTVDETNRANGSRWGGIQMYWQEEGSEKTASKPKFGKMELSLKKLVGLCYATDELLQDYAALATVITEGFSEEAGFKIDDSIINGTGAGQPLGILNSGALVTVSKETGQAATTAVWENIKKMYARLWARSRANMLWMANQDTLPELMSMVQTAGTGGVPVWLPANGAYGLAHDTLLGRPIIYPEQCETLGTLGDIQLIDPTQYIMITKGGLQMAASMHVRFIYDEQVFRFVYRIDGQPLWNAVLTPFKGTSNTQSPFIVLQARS